MRQCCRRSLHFLCTHFTLRHLEPICATVLIFKLVIEIIHFDFCQVAAPPQSEARSMKQKLILYHKYKI